MDRSRAGRDENEDPSLHPSLAVPETRIRSSATFLAEAEAAARDARAFVRATEEKYAYPDPLAFGSLGGRSWGVGDFVADDDERTVGS